MSLCFYAVCAARPRQLGRRRGVAHERLRAIACGDLVAVVGDVTASPRLDTETLRAYDATMRGLTTAVDAMLPVRFGTVVPDAAALCAVVGERRAALTEALALVAGREQMTLRVFGDAGRTVSRPAPRRAAATIGRGAGARYLSARRAAAARAHAVPEIDWLRPALARFVCAERTERHARPPLLASVHHLIPRGRATAYLAAVDRALRTRRAVRVVASGPSPAWAFASEDVA